LATLRVDEQYGRVRFRVHVQPRAAKNEIVGIHGDALKVRLTAPPVEDAANEALVALLADAIDVRRDSISILAGRTSRTKYVEVRGIMAERVRRLAPDARRDVGK
jgi:uncharacterized protein